MKFFRFTLFSMETSPMEGCYGFGFCDIETWNDHRHLFSIHRYLRAYWIIDFLFFHITPKEAE